MSYKTCERQLPVCKGNCCSNGVWVDIEEAQQIEKKVLATETLKDLHNTVLFEVEDDDPDYFPSGKGIGTKLKSPEGPCIFLAEDFTCRIYAFRPNFCQDYPMMHPLDSSTKPILLDNMFESDPNCIYHTLLKDTLQSIEDEKNQAT